MQDQAHIGGVLLMAGWGRGARGEERIDIHHPCKYLNYTLQSKPPVLHRCFCPSVITAFIHSSDSHYVVISTPQLAESLL